LFQDEKTEIAFCTRSTTAFATYLLGLRRPKWVWTNFRILRFL